MVTTLGMGALEFASWAVFCWITPVGCAVMAFMGLTVADKDGVLLCKKERLLDNETWNGANVYEPRCDCQRRKGAAVLR